MFLQYLVPLVTENTHAARAFMSHTKGFEASCYFLLTAACVDMGDLDEARSWLVRLETLAVDNGYALAASLLVQRLIEGSEELPTESTITRLVSNTAPGCMR